MKKLFKNWKTTFFGFATIIGGVAAVLKGDVVSGITAIGAGLGLGAAKDFDQTGL
jgi:hypothetical protein